MTLDICEDRWLSTIFGYSVFKVTASLDGHPLSLLDDSITRHANEQSHAMYYVKVGTDQVDVVRQLSQAGFYAVDVQTTLSLDPKKTPVPSMNRADVSIEEIRPEHHQRTLDIAGSCFKFSRFHLDPFIQKSIANRIKHDWILSYLQGQRGEKLWVALRDQQPAGFLAVLSSKSEGKVTRIIDLIGVHGPLQNRGIGKTLMGFFIHEYRDYSDFLQVGTQAANIPSMRLYQKLGFSIIQTQYVLHFHVRNGRKAPGA